MAVETIALETARARSERPFFGRIESMRGLGAMAVACYHMTGWAFPPGHGALMFFFVISGFVLSQSLQYGPQNPGRATGRFLLGRLFRVYPIVVFSILLVATLAVCQAFPNSHVDVVPTIGQLVANLLLLDVSMSGQLWAMQLEMVMAPIILVLFFVQQRVGPRPLFALAVVTTALAFAPGWAYWRPLSWHLFAFVLGMVVPTTGRQLVARPSRRTAMLWTLGAVAALTLPSLVLGIFNRWGSVIEAYGAFVLVSMLAYRLDLNRWKWLEQKGLRLLGQSSGSYYVLHIITIPPALLIAAAVVPSQWRIDAPGAVHALVTCVWLIAVIPVAIAGYYCIERPGIQLGRRFIRWCGCDKDPVAVETPRVSEQMAA